MKKTGAAAISTFTGVKLDQAERMLAYFTERSLDAGQEIFHKGEAGSSMAIIESGKVSVVRGGIEIAIITQGRGVGEITMLDGRSRTATCVASEPTHLLMLDSTTLRRMIANDADLAASLLLAVSTSLAGRLRRVDDRLAELAWGETY